MMEQHVIASGMALLPPRMDSPAARAMLYTIGMQESRFRHRRQQPGPARGFWQFERAGINGVLTHRATRNIIRDVLDALRYKDDVETSYAAIEHNDLLAACYARCLLWTLPGALPGPDEPDKGWQQYMAAWRPGEPHRQTWNTFFYEAARLDWGKT